MENITFPKHTNSVLTVLVNDSDFESERILVQNWRFVLEGILIPCIGLPGILGMWNSYVNIFFDRLILSGNMLTLMVLQQQDLELKPIFRHMLSLLLISDSSCILLTNIMFSLPVVSTRYALFTFPHLIPVLLPITQIFLTISVYTTIGVAVERFVSISTHTPQNRVRTILTLHRDSAFVLMVLTSIILLKN